MCKIRVRGRITKGKYKGWYLRVVADGTGGYLILHQKADQCGEGFDDWVEDQPSLEQYFEEADYDVQWEE